MFGGEGNSHSPQVIEILVNYWEMRPATMGARLDELLRLGVTHIATFVPWQAVESDISHTLPRFLQSIAERKMTVSLLLTPDVGVHYANSGLPKDVFSKPDNIAKHPGGQPVVVPLPPNAFPLPSLISPEFNKRYHNFLIRIDGFLAELSRNQPHLLEGVTAVLSGSFWKYYRSPQASAAGAFDGMAGDHSGCSAVAYRQRLEQFYAQREFADPNLAAVNRWKTRQMEDVNRRWFYQQSEDVFRNRSTQFVRKKALKLGVRQAELYTPEADPGFAYSQFLQLVTGGPADFRRLSDLLDEMASRSTLAGEGATAPLVHWTGLGGFRRLSDQERQFLILKSLLLMGARGGGVLIDEEQWFSLSHSFRSRAEALARRVGNGDLSLANQALYLAPHLWSGAGPLWGELQSKVGHGARLVAALDLALSEREARLLIVDPAYVFTRDTVVRLLDWARGGRVVVLPRSPLFTESARSELEKALAQDGGMEIELGISYRLQPYGDGRLVVYEVPSQGQRPGLPASDESLASWQTFLSSLLSVADIQSPSSLSDGRLKTVSLRKRGGGLGLFIMNATGRPVAADILFSSEVAVSDLGVFIKASPDVAPGGASAAPVRDAHPVSRASRFALEVPPCGILPISVDGLSRPEESRIVTAGTEASRARGVDSAWN